MSPYLLSRPYIFNLRHCLSLWPRIYYPDVPEMCQGLLDVRRDKISDEIIVRLAEPDDQQPGSRLSDGSAFLRLADQRYIKSGFFCRLQQRDHNRLLPPRAVLSYDVSNKLPCCVEFVMEQLGAPVRWMASQMTRRWNRLQELRPHTQTDATATQSS